VKQGLWAILTVASCAVAACATSAWVETIDGPYEAFAADTYDDLEVCYRLNDHECPERVGPTVVAWGWNNRFITVARHPRAPEAEHPDTSRTEYFYVVRPVDRPSDAKAAVRGPFDAASYSREAARLGLPPINHRFAD